MKKGWKTVGLVLGIAIVAFFVLSYLGVNPFFQFPPSYTRVVVPSDTIGSHTIDGTYATTYYTFQYGPSERLFGPLGDQTIVLKVGSISYVHNSFVPSNQNGKTYSLSLDATYEMGSKSSVYGGIEIKVSEIHSDYIVLLVKPL